MLGKFIAKIGGWVKSFGLLKTVALALGVFLGGGLILAISALGAAMSASILVAGRCSGFGCCGSLCDLPELGRNINVVRVKVGICERCVYLCMSKWKVIKKVFDFKAWSATMKSITLKDVMTAPFKGVLLYYKTLWKGIKAVFDFVGLTDFLTKGMKALVKKITGIIPDWIKNRLGIGGDALVPGSGVGGSEPGFGVGGAALGVGIGGATSFPSLLSSGAQTY